MKFEMGPHGGGVERIFLALGMQGIRRGRGAGSGTVSPSLWAREGVPVGKVREQRQMERP